MPFLDTSSLKVVERLPSWKGRFFHRATMTSRFCALGSGIGRYLPAFGFQFWMTVIGEALASSGTELITKDWPSGATM
jgi:hypothetical protein